MTEEEAQARARLVGARRIVVKVGTRLLANRTGKPAPHRIGAIVEGVSELMRAGREVVLVTSGAIGMGIDALGWKTRPDNLPDLQMAAAVGQARLVGYYAELFAKRRIKVGQVLLTHDILNNRTRHLNARNALNNLLRHRVLPIVNENDVVATDEIKVGDNDSLAALTTLLVDADVMVLLTTVNGLRAPGNSSPGSISPGKSGRTQRVNYLREVTAKARGLAKGSNSAISVGGMQTKLDAADWVCSSGALAVIADGRKAGELKKVFEGHSSGTLIGMAANGKACRASRKRWIAFFHRAQGVLIIDDGAKKAIIEHGRSLLPIGVREVKGNFEPGALVSIQSADGGQIARGLSDYASQDILKIKGLKTSDIAAVLGAKDYDEIVHRDNMVISNTAEERVG